nr:MAG TPA: hypothetical protein [Caudoviricetes sp.]
MFHFVLFREYKDNEKKLFLFFFLILLVQVSEQKKYKEKTNFIQTSIAALCDLYRTFALIIKAKWHGKQNR